jgi:3-methyl-2-oxobutanoate hydroxymethyltransferase
LVKKTIKEILSMKQMGDKITQITAYDYPMARLADLAGMDMILVGDSVGMVVLGYKSPIPVTVDDIIHHTKPVARGAKSPLIVGDLPFMSYHVSVEDSIRNAGRIIKEGGADAVKIEGGTGVKEKIEVLTEVGIPVQGHIGLMPQRATVQGGITVQGTDAESAASILEDALAIEEAGAFSVVLEFVAAEVAQVITERLDIPTIGIGSGLHCDGQVLVIYDVLGIYERIPPFAKKYADLRETILGALAEFKRDVRKGGFPGEEQTFYMNAEEKERLDNLQLTTADR